jgi:hypothetical protein
MVTMHSRPPLVPQESSLNPELACIVYLEMADKRAAVTGEQAAIRCNTGSGQRP